MNMKYKFFSSDAEWKPEEGFEMLHSMPTGEDLHSDYDESLLLIRMEFSHLKYSSYTIFECCMPGTKSVGHASSFYPLHTASK